MHGTGPVIDIRATNRVRRLGASPEAHQNQNEQAASRRWKALPVDHLALFCSGSFPESGPIKAPSSESAIFASRLRLIPGRSRSMGDVLNYDSSRVFQNWTFVHRLLSAGCLLERIWSKPYLASTFIALGFRAARFQTVFRGFVETFQGLETP